MKMKIKEWRMEIRGENAHLRGLHGLLSRWHLVGEIKKSRPMSG
jgi:hypothetical protein